MTTAGDKVRKGGAESVATGECAAWRTPRECGIRGRAGDESANRNVGATLRHTHARAPHTLKHATHTPAMATRRSAGGEQDRAGPDSTASETWMKGRMGQHGMERIRGVVADEDRKCGSNGRKGRKADSVRIERRSTRRTMRWFSERERESFREMCNELQTLEMVNK